MLVAKFPGSTYAIEAMTAGPPKAIAVRKPPGPPASAAMAREMVRPVRVDRSTAGAITLGLAVISCRIVSSGRRSAEAVTAKCSTGYRIGIALVWVNGSYCSQDYILTRQGRYDPGAAGPDVRCPLWGEVDGQASSGRNPGAPFRQNPLCAIKRAA